MFRGEAPAETYPKQVGYKVRELCKPIAESSRTKTIENMSARICILSQLGLESGQWGFGENNRTQFIKLETHGNSASVSQMPAASFLATQEKASLRGQNFFF